MHISYATSLRQRIYSLVLVPFAILALTYIALPHLSNVVEHYEPTNFGFLLGALGKTCLRLLMGYVCALALAVPLALLVTRNAWAERVFLPLFDIMQSLPVLAFFPIIIVFFVHDGFYNGAALFILCVTMLWSIVFSLVGGLRVIPQDIRAAGTIFGLHGLSYLKRILLPASLPYLITGSLLAFAAGWNIIIVAEVLHTYLPGSTESSDLMGIGSVLVSAAAHGERQTFWLAMLLMIATIALLNFFIWQKLLRYAEKFKFE